MEFLRSYEVGSNLQNSIWGAKFLCVYFSEAIKFSLVHLLVIAATARSHWTESNNTEPHIGNTPFYPSQEDHSGSRKGVTAQTARMSHSSSGAPGNPSFLPETNADGRNTSSRKANITVLQAGHSPEITTALTAHGSSLCECHDVHLHMPYPRKQILCSLPTSRATVPI